MILDPGATATIPFTPDNATDGGLTKNSGGTLTLGGANIYNGNTAVNVGLTLAYLPLVPTIFRYSRVVWVHFDRWVCPSDSSAGAYAI